MYFIIALIITFVVVIFYLNRREKRTGQKTNWKTIALVIGFISLIAALSRVHLLSAAIAALLPFLRSLFPLLLRFAPMLQQVIQRRRFQQGASQNPNQDSTENSEVQTIFLAMTLDHNSGEISGTVIQGKFHNRSLASLDLQELQSLYSELEQHDNEGKTVFESYLEQRFGEDWYDMLFPSQQRAQSHNRNHNSDISVAEAQQILGLQEPYSEADIISAHKKLMQKLHPDRGGNNYLAAQVNGAKETLLKFKKSTV